MSAIDQAIVGCLAWLVTGLALVVLAYGKAR